MRDKILVVLGWAGLFVIGQLILAPIIDIAMEGTVLPYENIMPLVAAVLTIGVSIGFVLFIPVSALIVLTMKVFDHDGLS